MTPLPLLLASESKMAMDISVVNKLGYEEFNATFGNVIEHGLLCTAAIWSQRPFRDVRHLHQEYCKFIDALPQIGKEGILRSHPDLAGRLAELGQLSPESTREQEEAGIIRLTPQERHLMNTLNNRYKEKFNFPFVICARKNKKEAIMKGLEERLGNEYFQESDIGVREVKDICYLRLADIIDEGSVTFKKILRFRCVNGAAFRYYISGLTGLHYHAAAAFTALSKHHLHPLQ